MDSNGGRAAGFGKREFYTVLALLVMVFSAAGAMFAVPAWAQAKQEAGRQASEAQRERIENLSDAETEEQFVRAAQTSEAAGDLEGESAEAEQGSMTDEVDRIVIEGVGDCEVDRDATITFQEEDDGENEIGVVENGDGAEIDSRNDRIVITPGSGTDINFIGDIDLDPGDLAVLSSSGIDCNGDDDDGFDDELLLLLLLELLEDDNNNDDGDDGDGDGGDGDDGNDGDDDGDGDDGDGTDATDLNGDGVISQEEEAEAAENGLNGEGTDGEDTDGEFGAENFDEGDDGVSATADEDGAEASTPGASASAGGDPDEQAPVTDPQGDVVDDVVTSGPLPNTGGVPVAGTVLAMVLFGAGLLVVRLVMIWRAGRA